MRYAKLSARKTSLFALSAIALAPGPAWAQSTIAPLVATDDREYRIEPIPVGPLRVEPRLIATAHYDSNIYAVPDNEVDDVVLTIRPELDVAYGDQSARLQLESYFSASRLVELASENSESYGIRLNGRLSPSGGHVFSTSAGYERLTEDRGDPEASNLVGSGPRLIDTTYAVVGYRKTDGRVLFDLDAEVREFDVVSPSNAAPNPLTGLPIDRERDFVSYSARATVGLQVGGSLYAIANAFVNKRDFRIDEIATLPDRDATTYGGRLGVRWTGQGPIRGDAAVGIFRYEPQDSTLDARTGVSVDASLAFHPRRRTAILIEGFRGDVATFRLGANARTDTRLSATVQQEVRHNLFGRLGAVWRKTKFVGTTISEETYGPTAAVEYLVNRNLSLIVNADYRKRVSDDPFERFERFRTALTMRLRI